MDVVLRQLRRPGPASLVRKYPLLWHGVCGDARYGLGLDHCHVLHPVRCHGHGYEISDLSSSASRLTRLS